MEILILIFNGMLKSSLYGKKWCPTVIDVMTGQRSLLLVKA